MPVSTLDKFRGAMLGSAVGDAIGELASAHTDLDSLTDWIGEGDVLRYTDDTAMSIGLAEALSTSGGAINEEEIGKIFQRNYGREPWRDYSSSVPAIFASAKRHDMPFSEAAARLHDGTGSFGNGAAMRIAPLGILYRNSDKLRDCAEQSARITHAHAVGIDGAAIMAWAVAQLANLDPKSKFPFAEFCTGIVRFAQTREMRLKLVQVIELIAGKASPKNAAKSLTLSQSVAESLPYSLYSFLSNMKSFEDCLYCAILQGGDRDTLGSMAGALSGSFLGAKAIPKDWISRIENLDTLEDLAKRLNGLSV
ncbi:MAG: ADP-ribosylglycohydrolase family protein [Alphaproteobacteria bacterium]|nr:ADP-ribosylglycohydrolase family protein [Alphaproteobacteria bacterium]